MFDPTEEAAAMPHLDPLPWEANPQFRGSLRALPVDARLRSQQHPDDAAPARDRAGTNLARIYQASDEKIRAVWEFETSPLFTAAERAALRLGYHAALVPNEATAEDFAALKAHFDDSQIVEIVATISRFGYLNRCNDTMATTLEQRASTWPIGRSRRWGGRRASTPVEPPAGARASVPR